MQILKDEKCAQLTYVLFINFGCLPTDRRFYEIPATGETAFLYNGKMKRKRLEGELPVY